MDMLSRLTSWSWRQPFADQDELILDFRQTQFIEPWAIAMFISHALHLQETVKLPITLLLEEDNPANLYLKQMGLTKIIYEGKSATEWENSAQNTGLHLIKTHADLALFSESLKRLEIASSQDTADALLYCVSELGRNVVQHASSASGGVAMAQVFPDRERIQITVCDSGQGILGSLMASHPELMSDEEALRAAILPHVSKAFAGEVSSTSENAGLGLFFTKEIAWRVGGGFFLVSGDRVLSEHDNSESEESRLLPVRKYRQTEGRIGTSVTVDIPINQEFDFAKLLELCRELAKNARKSPGEAGLDFLIEDYSIGDVERIEVGEFQENVEKAKEIRETRILPAILDGNLVVLDFKGSRFVTQSFVHALLNDVFRVSGSINRLSFINCTHSTEEAIRVVAAYAAVNTQL